MQIDYLNRTWKILAIDDSKLNRAVIRKTLSQLNVVIDEASDGLEGLEAMKKENYDLVLVDIIMPNLDGFGFLSRVKEHTGENFIPVILMTGTDDLNSKIKGLRIGADDFLLKPLNEKELVARVLSLLRLKWTHDELYQKNKQIKKEMEIAKRVQQYIIPKDFSHINYPVISGRYLPIEDIGGDFFDCYQLPDNKYGFLIADVVGHGIPAALIMTMSKMIFNVYSTDCDTPDKMMDVANRNIRGLLLDNQYVTSFYIIYDNNSKRIHFTNAGHVKVLYFRASKNRMLGLDSDGFFLGISDQNNYEAKSIPVEEGDRIFLYTDGITEIKNNEDEEYGEKRLAKSIIKNTGIHGDAFCDEILKEVSQFTNINERNDDIAFLSIEF
jgi:serine phosphatase RsbU (regulator of sigma subunit)